MKKYRSVLSLLFASGLGFAILSLTATAQTTAPNEWTWMGGSSVLPGCSPSPACAGGAVYGTLGVPSATNIPGGRNSSVGWTDKRGNFWLFGGIYSVAVSTTGELNDLWEYSPSNGQWAWMGGSSTIGSNCITVIDITGSTSTYCGKPGVYGTLGTPAAANIPGGRYGAVSWTDSSGNFWLFGGEGFDSTGAYGDLSDLWSFNPTTGGWTWISGSDVVNQPGVYGNLGKSAFVNIPGGRYGANSWIDGTGNLWLFGGSGRDSSSEEGDLNDLWAFNPTTKQWTWMNGSSLEGQNGTYGSIGTPAPANTPNSRSAAVSWTDSSGNFWLMGGDGYSFTTQGPSSSVSRRHPLDITFEYIPPIIYGDLWRFDVAAQQWVMVSPDTVNSVPGTLGVPSIANGPLGFNLGGIVNSTAYVDKNDNAWLLSPNYDYYEGCNYLMDFKPSASEWAWMGGSCSNSGVYGTTGVSAAGNFPGGRAGAVGWTDSKGDFWLFGGIGTDSARNKGDLNDLWVFQPSAGTLPPAITPLIEWNGGVGGPQNFPITFSFYNGMANAVFYYTTDGTTPTTNSAEASGSITLSAPATVEAIAAANGYPTSGVESVTYTLMTMAAAPTFSVPSGTYNSAQTITISDATPNAQIYFETNPVDYAYGLGPGFSGPYNAPVTLTFTSTETLSAVAAANNFNNSATVTATYTIPTGFTAAATPASLSVAAGQSGTATISITPLSGFNSAVSFTCSGLPAGALCSFAPQTVTPPGATSTTLTVSTAATSASLHRSSGPLIPAASLAVVLCCFGLRKRRRLHMLLLLAVSAVGLCTFSACGGSGGGSSNKLPQPVTSTITVTATSGALLQTTTLSLTVN